MSISIYIISKKPDRSEITITPSLSISTMLTNWGSADSLCNQSWLSTLKHDRLNNSNGSSAFYAASLRRSPSGHGRLFNRFICRWEDVSYRFWLLAETSRTPSQSPLAYSPCSRSLQALRSVHHQTSFLHPCLILHYRIYFFFNYYYFICILIS